MGVPTIGRFRTCLILRNRCAVATVEPVQRSRARRSFGKAAAILPISADSGVFFSASRERPARPRAKIYTRIKLHRTS